MAIAVTYLERSPAGPRNVVTLFDSAGREALTYAKVHTCSFDLPEQALAPGTEFPVARLETRAGPVAVGAMICFDREFPEAARLLALGGAELILVPNACELEANRLGQVRARAFENMVAVAVANYAAPHGQRRRRTATRRSSTRSPSTRRVAAARRASSRPGRRRTSASSASTSPRCASGAGGRCGGASAGGRRPTARWSRTVAASPPDLLKLDGPTGADG